MSTQQTDEPELDYGDEPDAQPDQPMPDVPPVESLQARADSVAPASAAADRPQASEAPAHHSKRRKGKGGGRGQQNQDTRAALLLNPGSASASCAPLETASAPSLGTGVVTATVDQRQPAVAQQQPAVCVSGLTNPGVPSPNTRVASDPAAQHSLVRNIQRQNNPRGGFGGRGRGRFENNSRGRGNSYHNNNRYQNNRGWDRPESDWQQPPPWDGPRDNFWPPAPRECQQPLPPAQAVPPVPFASAASASVPQTPDQLHATHVLAFDFARHALDRAFEFRGPAALTQQQLAPQQQVALQQANTPLVLPVQQQQRAVIVQSPIRNARRHKGQKFGKAAQGRQKAALHTLTEQLRLEDRTLTRDWTADATKLRASASDGLAAYSNEYQQAKRTWERLSNVKYERCWNARQRKLQAPFTLFTVHDISGIQRPQHCPEALTGEHHRLARQLELARIEVQNLRERSTARWIFNNPEHADSRALVEKLATVEREAHDLDTQVDQFAHRAEQAQLRYEAALHSCEQLAELSDFVCYLRPLSWDAQSPRSAYLQHSRGTGLS